MKRYLFLMLLMVIAAQPLQADYDDGRSNKGPLGRALEVEGRGWLNAAGMPFEITSTLTAEIKRHKWLWPATYAPRLLHNVINRTASAIHDIFIFPWVALGTDDISPWTEGVGLPDYPWQAREQTF